MAIPALRRLDHPDFSDYLIHLTGRPRESPDLPFEIRQLTAQERLQQVLKQQKILAMKTFYAEIPVVCFTESTRAGLNYLFSNAGYKPWGIVFERETIYSAGDGPVFHFRGDEYRHKQLLPERMRARVIEYSPGRAEWLEEREWRIPFESGTGFRFNLKDVRALIVGTRAWNPSGPDPECPLWIWDSWDEHLVELEPLSW